MARPDALDLWFGRPWALTAAKFDEIQQVVDARLAGVELAYDAGDAAEGDLPPYTVVDAVAVLPVHGVLSKRANLFTRVSGGTSTELLRRDLDAALADPAVDAVVLDIDSPGGAADGTKVLADYIAAHGARAGGRKPIVAYADGCASSAAYWLASAADHVVADPTAEVGSIGVRMTHTDRSAQHTAEGIRKTEIYSGAYKTAGSNTGPLDDQSRAYLQSRCDRLYTIFVEDVAAHRGLTVASALAAADGKIWIGAEARQQGLVDEIGDLEAAIRAARKELTMDQEQLRAEHTDLYQTIYAEGVASVTVDDPAPQLAAAAAEATAAERARATRIVETRGPVDLTLAALADGATPGDFALTVLDAERSGRAADLDRLDESLAPAVPPAGADKGAGAEVIDFMAAAEAYRAEHACSRAQAIREVTRKNPDLRQAMSDQARAALTPTGG